MKLFLAKVGFTYALACMTFAGMRVMWVGFVIGARAIWRVKA